MLISVLCFVPVHLGCLPFSVHTQNNFAYFWGKYTYRKNAGLFQPKFGSNMDKPKCWVKNAIQIVIPTSTFTFSCTFVNYIFNPAFGFVHIWPNFGFGSV